MLFGQYNKITATQFRGPPQKSGVFATGQPNPATMGHALGVAPGWLGLAASAGACCWAIVEVPDKRARNQIAVMIRPMKADPAANTAQQRVWQQD